MLDIVLFLMPSFVACLSLIGILGYLGIHVIEREIIFIDISLAQIAAVGYVTGFLVLDIGSPDEGGLMIELLALGMTVLAALFFSVAGKRICQISQETIIGVSYAIAAAATLFLLAFHAGGDVHMAEMLTGSIIWVQWGEIGVSAAVFAVVGLFHYAFRKRFIALSFADRCSRDMQESHDFFWNFLFYVSMGVVITQAVKIAGLLLTFSLLVMPATFTMLFAARLGARLIIAWIMAALASIGGLAFAYRYDFSTGPSIVSVMALMLIVAAILKQIVRRTGLEPEDG